MTQPANGAVVITGGGTGVSYTPNANYCNSPPGTTPDTFTYTLNGGSIATVSMTVTCAADAPVVDTSAGTTGYTENARADADRRGGDRDRSRRQLDHRRDGADHARTTPARRTCSRSRGVHPGITAMQIGDTLTLSAAPRAPPPTRRRCAT